MGFDLYGLRAKSKTGEYFRNNCWWWRPLADYVITNCEINGKHWDYNDGHLVKEEEAIKIADKLDELLKSGHTKKYASDYKKQLSKLPLEVCDLCKGTGIRNDEIIKGKCNACDGVGKKKSWQTYYPFSVTNVREFSKFCRESGGFTIC